jgi:hypothetical protein
MSLRTTLLALAFAASCAATPPAPAPKPTPKAAPPAPPAPQTAGDPESLFKKMEAALTGAKSLHVDFESTGDTSSVKGSFKITDGKKLEMKIDGRAGVKKYTLTLTCDGEKMKVTRSETPAPPVPLQEQPELPAAPALATNVAAALARGGAWLAQTFADAEYRRAADPWFIERQDAGLQNRPMNPVPPPPARDLASLYTLSNFRGKGEVTYDLVRKDEVPLVIVTQTVWIDSKGMPTKRQGQFFAAKDGKPDGPALSTWTETCTIK